MKPKIIAPEKGTTIEIAFEDGIHPHMIHNLKLLLIRMGEFHEFPPNEGVIIWRCYLTEGTLITSEMKDFLETEIDNYMKAYT